MAIPKHLIIQQPSCDVLSAGLQDWSWRGLDDLALIMVGAFGDWFFLDSAGRVVQLSVLDASMTVIASTRQEFVSLAASTDYLDRWFLGGFVESLLSRGIVLREGECFAFKVPPILGAPIRLENTHVANFFAYQLFVSQLHKHIHDNPGEPISKILVNGEEP